MSRLPGVAESTTAPTSSLLGRRSSLSQRTAALATLCAGAALAYFYAVWYPRTGDVAPDSVYGYGFAIAGTGLLLAVGVGYAVRKRGRQHWPGRLHTMLAWHMAGALLGLVLVLMHAAGNFNPRSGTYALYGLVSLIVSGLVGRALDRVCPWLAARAARHLLSSSGEQRLGAFQRPLADTPRAGRRVDLARSSSPVPGVPWNLADQAATQREQFYLQLVRTWRRVHALLSLVFLGLLAWHLIYAATLLMKAR